MACSARVVKVAPAKGTASLLSMRTRSVVRATPAEIGKQSADTLVSRPTRPVAESPAPPPKRLFGTEAEPAAPPASTAPRVMTLELQRQRAKEMRAYFLEQKVQQAAVKAQVFGWTAKNEISNGRWVMFGLMVGMLTEFATGVDFPHQLALMASYLGIVDLD